MAYNIDTWKQKECTSLFIKKDKLREILNSWNELNKKEFCCPCGDPTTINLFDESSTITITSHGEDHIQILNIDIHGEGSGTVSNEVIEPILKNTKGRYFASTIWEGGDSIADIKSADGKIEWIEREL